ncbi:ATP-dependent RNA helicase RhlE [Tangfeifania diversioriginum]|uniref:ATP-dependent RNA helicase RhlE n=1 Tax=Tangfeifania diversioriginum TaxID=1168035 RepID=A0A1M6BBI8_9BACT|nr:DEAD/DEAH box helicase [Tangfeifania diversioriginum]SHI45813.1 ATP-dependent RNA helicase RhlE [Tangfeifania diversioriginum]
MKKTFEELKIAKSILKSLDDIGFKEPTPIQEQAIPKINSGTNVVGVAQTGTGKTAAYLLPLLTKLRKPEGNDPRVVILVPTRELSIQVGEDVAELTTRSELRHAAVYGGIGWTKHAEIVEPGIDILVATPGRLRDLYNNGVLSLKKVKYLVIDEADRMLDMGFMPQLRQLFDILPRKRQNLLFSATFSENVEKLAEEFLDFYEKLEVSPSATPVEEVTQLAYNVPNYRTKLNLLKYLLLDEGTFSRIIIFVKTKEHADGVYKVVKRKVEGEIRILHSNKAQSTRINAIQAFKHGEVRVLITTDVSARGMDASMVSHVINFDVPSDYENYVHRIGRTARAGNRGNAITFIAPSEEWHWKKIEELIRMEIPLQELPEGVEVVETDFDERQRQLREIDRQRKIDDPTYQGAFHQRKKKEGAKKNYSDRFKRTKKRQKRSKRTRR